MRNFGNILRGNKKSYFDKIDINDRIALIQKKRY